MPRQRERHGQSTSDADEITASQSDAARFATVFDRHGARILAYLTRRVGPDRADDLAAETFLRAFRSRGHYRPVHPTALPWLYGIATNLLRDQARLEQKRLDLLGRLAVSPRTDADFESVDDALIAAEGLPRVVRAIAELSDENRDVLVLIAVEGLSYGEAAEALGTPVGTIRSRLARARMQLRRSIGESGSTGSPGAGRAVTYPKGGIQ